MPGRRDADPFGGDDAARRLHARYRSARIAADARDFAILDDVDAQCVGGAGIAPGDRVVPRRAAAPLQRRAQHRIAHIGFDIEWRAEGLGLFGRQPFVVDAVDPVGVDVAFEHLHVMDVVRQHHHAALREHDVVVELLTQPLPHLQRMVVERGALVEEIVGADDRRVAACVAAADPALLHHRDVAHPELAGEIIGCAQPVPAAADDDRVVGGFGRSIAPLGLPPLVPAKSLPEQRECGEALHQPRAVS